MYSYIYILRCRDGSYYVGSAPGVEAPGDDLERRVNEHNAGKYPTAYTFKRRPVELVFNQEFTDVTEAIAAERRIKGWTRAKKEALIRGDFDALKVLAQNRTDHPHPSQKDKPTSSS
jgi:putative endonuclease